MDFARESFDARFYPKLYLVEKQEIYERFLSTSHPDEAVMDSLFLQGASASNARGNMLMYDCIMVTCKTNVLARIMYVPNKGSQ